MSKNAMDQTEAFPKAILIQIITPVGVVEGGFREPYGEGVLETVAQIIQNWDEVQRFCLPSLEDETVSCVLAGQILKNSILKVTKVY